MSLTTPGPWCTDGVVVWASDDGGKSFDVPVCVIPSRNGSQLTVPAPRASTCGLSDSDLLAAAPDLLAAAKRALDEMRTTVAPRDSFTDAVDCLDAAISKAEGQ